MAIYYVRGQGFPFDVLGAPQSFDGGAPRFAAFYSKNQVFSAFFCEKSSKIYSIKVYFCHIYIS